MMALSDGSLFRAKWLKAFSVVTNVVAVVDSSACRRGRRVCVLRDKSYVGIAEDDMQKVVSLGDPLQRQPRSHLSFAACLQS
jgi:hypothetical protein